MNVYVASKSRHAPMWQAVRSAARHNFNVISTWIDEAGEGETESFSDLWARCIHEAKRADAVVAYHEEGEVWKGAFVEIGAALAQGNQVYVVGNPPGSWTSHPNVHMCESLADALDRMTS